MWKEDDRALYIYTKINIFYINTKLRAGIPKIGCTSYTNKIHFWDILLNKCLTISNPHENPRISSMELLPNMQIATTAHDKLIKIWDITRHKLITH